MCDHPLRCLLGLGSDLRSLSCGSCEHGRYTATLTLSVMSEEDGNTRGRNERLRGQIGVKTRALNDGWTIGPPADREYAVEPVGVETISPSD